MMLAVWRESCRHIQIAESLATIAQLLARQLPIDRLTIRRIDADLAHLETVASGPRTDDESSGDGLSEWGSEDVKRLVHWCHRGEIMLRRGEDRRQHIAFAAIPRSLTGDVLVAPLASEHGTLGVLLLRLKTGSNLDASQERACHALLEPLAVALENDRRLRELNALREAAEADNRSLLARLGRNDLSETIIGMDDGLQPVMERVNLVARSDAAVLILGETGSGKEVVARAIHHRSLRASGPFIRVNCGAIPPELVDSELFGHEKGSFTGAAATRRGWFERADEGTLFLDEVGELPLAAQVRLLRVLQDGLFERVGGEKSRHVDVRVVAATHRDLATMVQQRDFREDLWYRIAVFPIMLPPLRKRVEDIPGLAEHFARRAAKRFGLKEQALTANDLSLLVSYSWPGNVRELASVMDRSAILGNGERLDVARALGAGPDAAVPPPPETPSPPRPAGRAPTYPGDPASFPSLDAAMGQHIQAALAAARGRIEGSHGAAALLKINPHTLRARMRKLAIDWSRFRT